MKINDKVKFIAGAGVLVAGLTVFACHSERAAEKPALPEVGVVTVTPERTVHFVPTPRRAGAVRSDRFDLQARRFQAAGRAGSCSDANDCQSGFSRSWRRDRARIDQQPSSGARYLSSTAARDRDH